MMKKILTWCLVLILLLGSFGALAQDAGTNMVTITSFPSVVDTIGLQMGSHIRVGNTTPMSGYFATDLFGANTADMDVRALLSGYETVSWTRTLGLSINGTAISSVETTARDNGNRIYTFALAEGLTYNNGQAITAEDYVFSVLLGGSPLIGEVGGTQLGMSHIVGYDAYAKGEVAGIRGIRLLSPSSFSLEIDGAYLPFFYGLGMLGITPYPMSVIAPGCTVQDSAAGVSIVRSGTAATMDAEGLPYTPGEFSADMLSYTLLDEAEGYVFNPRVTSGPYTFISYDPETQTATFEANTRFLGNYEGQKPHIQRLTFQYMKNETMFEAYENGEVDLLNKVANGDAIDRGMALSDAGVLEFGQYLRSGFTFLAFACEEGPTASQAVRRAIAHCFDKRTFTYDIVGAIYGLPVFGYYGLGQWMYNQNFLANEEAGLPALDTTQAVDALEIPMDLSVAKSLLVGDGWTLNESGAPYVEGEDTLRYRMNETGALEPLTIAWAKSEGSAIADALEEVLRGPLGELGVELVVDTVPFDEVLAQYYRQTERTYNMFFLASNFGYIFDPYYDFNTAEEYQGMTNTSGLQDEELMRIALDMRSTTPSDMHAYAVKWVEFQERFVELMPMIPLYSNLYHDFYTPTLQGYDIAQHSGWALAIPYAYIADEPIVAAPEGETIID